MFWLCIFYVSSGTGNGNSVDSRMRSKTIVRITVRTFHSAKSRPPGMRSVHNHSSAGGSMVANRLHREAEHIHIHAASILGVSPLRPLYTSTAWCVRYWENLNPQYTKISQTEEQGGLKVYDVHVEFILNRYTPKLNLAMRVLVIDTKNQFSWKSGQEFQ